jgi:predicted esterase
VFAVLALIFTTASGLGAELATGDMRLEFTSPVDATVQPYRLYVPPGIAASGAYPLVIVLHGHRGDENTYFDRYLDRVTGEPAIKKLARERGYIVAAPRRYQHEYEADVLWIVDRVAEVYPIRGNEIFLTGHSSGGVGTWQLGYRHPQRFAALAAVGSAFAMQPAVLDRLIRPEHAAKPMLYCQGTRDALVPNRGASRLVDSLRGRLPNFVYREFPDPHGSLGATSLPTVFDFFDAVRDQTPLMASDIPTAQEYAVVPAVYSTKKLVKKSKGKRYRLSSKRARAKVVSRKPRKPQSAGKRSVRHGSRRARAGSSTRR